MAILRKRGSSYLVDFRLTGRRYKRSLGTEHESTAKAALARLEDNLHRVSIGTLEIPEGVDVPDFLLSDGRRRVTLCEPKKPHAKTGTAPRITRLEELCAQAIGSIPENSLEQNSIRQREIHARHLKKVLSASFAVDKISLTVLQSYVNKRSKMNGRWGNKVAPETIRKELDTLRWMLNYGYKAGLIKAIKVPMKDLRFSKVNEKPPFQTWEEIKRKIDRGGLTVAEEKEMYSTLFLRLDEIEQILAHIETNSSHAFLLPMVATAAYTGARRSELIRSQLDDIDLQSKKFTFREKKRQRGRLSTRRVPIAPRLKKILQDWIEIHPGGNVTFCISAAESTSRCRSSALAELTPAQASRYLAAALANSKWSVLHGWHTFRHSFCSICAAKGRDQRVINQWAGHQTEEMVRRYRHLFPDNEQDDIREVFG